MSLDERLDQIVSRHQELSNLMSSGDGGDADEFVRMSREFAELDPIVAAIRELRAAQRRLPRAAVRWQHQLGETLFFM